MKSSIFSLIVGCFCLAALQPARAGGDPGSGVSAMLIGIENAWVNALGWR